VLRRRSQLVKARTRAKNEVHGTLIRRLVAKPKLSDLFVLAGRRWLVALALPAEERETVDAALRQIDFLERELEAVERAIAMEALSSAEMRRLMSVPGANMITAATFLAAIGDVARFGSTRRLAGYLGLDPRVRQSGPGPAKHGRSSKQGSSPARCALVEAAWSMVRQPRPLRAFYQTHPGPARPPGRDRGQRADAGLPVLVPAHARAGPRLRPAVADQEEAPPARAHRRGPQGQGQAGDLGRQQGRAPSRAGARAPRRGRISPHRRRLAGTPQRRGRDTGTRISRPSERQSSAARHRSQNPAL